MFHWQNYFNELFQSNVFFWFCAFIGSGMFFIQFLINIFFCSVLDNLATEDVSFSDSSKSPSDIRAFKWVSMQTITGFLMMFGWTAITCRIQFGLESLTTTGISLTVGVLTAFIISLILRIAKKLHSSGSVFRIEEAIGQEAYIYQTIPKNGVGKISISLQNLTHEIDAVSHDFEEISSFTRVKIIETKDDNTVVVALIS